MTMDWIVINEDDETTLPPVNEYGDSDYVLLSFDNADFPCIGQYRKDRDGGAWYDGDSMKPLIKWGLIVNAWMPCPKPYREETE